MRDLNSPTVITEARARRAQRVDRIYQLLDLALETEAEVMLYGDMHLHAVLMWARAAQVAGRDVLVAEESYTVDGATGSYPTRTVRVTVPYGGYADIRRPVVLVLGLPVEDPVAKQAVAPES